VAGFENAANLQKNKKEKNRKIREKKFSFTHSQNVKNSELRENPSGFFFPHYKLNTCVLKCCYKGGKSQEHSGY
jgi:hypothetical protein